MPVVVDSADNVENPRVGGQGLCCVSALPGSVLGYARYEFSFDYFCVRLLDRKECVRADMVDETWYASCIGVDEL